MRNQIVKLSDAQIVEVLRQRSLARLPGVHEIDVATQLRLDGRQLLHALLHLVMQLHSKHDKIRNSNALLCFIAVQPFE